MDLLLGDLRSYLEYAEKSLKACRSPENLRYWKIRVASLKRSIESREKELN